MNKIGLFIHSLFKNPEILATGKINPVKSDLEEKFRLKAEELTDVLDRINDGFIMIDRNYCYTYVNSRMGEMTGRKPDSLLGKNIWEEFPDAVGTKTYLAFKEAMEKNEYRFNLDYFEALDLWQENYIYPAKDGLSVFIRDISDQKRAEVSMRKSERVYAAIATNIPGSVICLIDTDYRYTLVEGDLLEKIGYKKEMLLNHRIQDAVPAERASFFLPYLKKAMAGESLKAETTLAGYDLQYRLVPLKNENGEVYCVMIVGIDITELKKAQKSVEESNASLEAKVVERTLQLEAVNKELESFSYSVAHDLRSPLRALKCYTQIALEDYGNVLDHEGNRIISAISSNAEKMTGLINGLLNFSRLGRKTIVAEPINMDQLTEDVIAELKPTMGVAGHIIAEPLPDTMGDVMLIKQVLINLISNAIKYSSKKENPLIKITSEEEEGYNIYKVSDNGAGFNMTYVEKLFGVFQRLHTGHEFEGTGVGLAIVQKIINKHGGKVRAESVLDEGASFYFTLPSIPAPINIHKVSEEL